MSFNTNIIISFTKTSTAHTSQAWRIRKGHFPEILITWIWSLMTMFDLFPTEMATQAGVEYLLTICSKKISVLKNITINSHSAASCCFIFLENKTTWGVWCSLVFRHSVKRVSSQHQSVDTACHGSHTLVWKLTGRWCRLPFALMHPCCWAH